MTNSFRFHAPTSIATSNSLRRLRKQKLHGTCDPTLFGADTAWISHTSGRWPIEAYSDLAGSFSVTLTRKEADLIALSNPGVRPPLALEELHPWLPVKNYQEDSAENLRTLKTMISQFGSHLVTPAAFCDEKWNKVCNSIHMTTDLDIRFYSAWHLPLQDTYVLAEQRPDRRVIALDFNAMYPFCMQQLFPKPSKMRHVIYDRQLSDQESLPHGLFRCRLEFPSSDFIQKYNPFRTFFAGRHLGFKLQVQRLI